MLGEKEAALRLKGENGLLRKNLDEQQKAIDDSQALLRAAEADKRQLGQVGWAACSPEGLGSISLGGAMGSAHRREGMCWRGACLHVAAVHPVAPALGRRCTAWTSCRPTESLPRPLP